MGLTDEKGFAANAIKAVNAYFNRRTLSKEYF